jgi:hypothetical protein
VETALDVITPDFEAEYDFVLDLLAEDELCGAEETLELDVCFEDDPEDGILDDDSDLVTEEEECPEGPKELKDKLMVARCDNGAEDAFESLLCLALEVVEADCATEVEASDVGTLDAEAAFELLNDLDSADDV